MLANGAMPMLSAAASAEGRLAGSGDMLDRRILAATATTAAAANESAENAPPSTPQSAEVQQGQECAESPVLPSPEAAAAAESRASKRPFSVSAYTEGGGGGGDGTVRIGSSGSSNKTNTSSSTNGTKNKVVGEANRNSEKKAKLAGAAVVEKPPTMRVAAAETFSVSQPPPSAPSAPTESPSSAAPSSSPAPSTDNNASPAAEPATQEDEAPKSVGTGAQDKLETSQAVAVSGHGSSGQQKKATPAHKPSSHPSSPTNKTSANGADARSGGDRATSATTPIVQGVDGRKTAGIAGTKKARWVESAKALTAATSNRRSEPKPATKTTDDMDVDTDARRGVAGHPMPVDATSALRAEPELERGGATKRKAGYDEEDEQKSAGLIDRQVRITENEQHTSSVAAAPVYSSRSFGKDRGAGPRDEPMDSARHKSQRSQQRKQGVDHDDSADDADPALGEGWDENGNDLSKVANEAIRKAHCEAWVSRLRQEAAAIRSQDHPEVMRRSHLTIRASKRRLDMSERNAKRQKFLAEELFEMELANINESYEVAVEQTRERLLLEINEEIRRSKSRMDGYKEVENRMNTRHTRGNAKGSIEDPWPVTASGAKSNLNSKRPLCHVELTLSDDEATEDIESLRYSGYGDVANGGNSGGNGSYSDYGDGASASGGGGRSRRLPAWRRED